MCFYIPQLTAKVKEVVCRHQTYWIKLTSENKQKLFCASLSSHFCVKRKVQAIKNCTWNAWGHHVYTFLNAPNLILPFVMCRHTKNTKKVKEIALFLFFSLPTHLLNIFFIHYKILYYFGNLWNHSVVHYPNYLMPKYLLTPQLFSTFQLIKIWNSIEREKKKIFLREHQNSHNLVV